jgi:hypothetical protein
MENTIVTSIGEYFQKNQGNKTIYDSLFPETNYRDFAYLLDEFVSGYTNNEIESLFFFYISVGFSLGVISGNRRYFVKALKDEEDRYQEIIAYLVELRMHCIRCPVIFKSKKLGGILFILMEYNVHGEFQDLRDDKYLRPVVKELHKLHTSYKQILDKKEIAVEKLWSGDLKTGWYNPHNSLFDFSRFQEETRWIDDKMHESLNVINEENEKNCILSHLDWSGKHFKFDKNNEITIIYDWDSLFYTNLYGSIARAALTYVYNDEIGKPGFSTIDEIARFIHLYEEYQGRNFISDEYIQIAGHLTYISSKICKIRATFIGNSADDVKRLESDHLFLDLKSAGNGLYPIQGI